MKKIYYHKSFSKQYKKLVRSNPKYRKIITDRINLFLQTRKSLLLHDHKLSGNLHGLRSFSVSGDIRIVYFETPDHCVFVDIGTHSQVY